MAASVACAPSARVERLARDQAPDASRLLYDVVATLPGPLRVICESLAHSPAALRLFLDVTRAMSSLALAPALRELAFVVASRQNRSRLCDAVHSGRGRAAGLGEAKLAGLADPDASGAYTERERLVIRYAEQLTVAGAVPDELHAALAEHLDRQELVELALTVAAANLATRLTAALALEPASR
jgi:AhpD family alkylhydroperoxidase